MWQVTFKDGTKKWFSTSHCDVGDWYQSFDGTWHIVESVDAGSAKGEYGTDRGWFYELREATAEELAKWEQEKAARAALTPEERVEKQVDTLSAMFPGLDW